MIILMIQVNLTGGQALYMRVGDHYGFSWTTNGSIMYNKTEQCNFCEEEGVLEVGSTKSLTDMRNGYREYSIQLLFHPLSTAGQLSYII